MDKTQQGRQLDAPTQFLSVMSYNLSSCCGRIAVFILLTVFSLSLPGQYAIDHAVVSGGGGSSTSGRFSVEGTLGQALTGTQAGGEYVLTSGVWSLLTLVATPSTPSLQMSWDLSEAGPRIYWDKSDDSWVLEQTDLLNGASTTWAPVEGPYNDGVTHREVTITASPGQRFFRLQRQ